MDLGINQIKRHEGKRNMPYTDSTGHQSIGYGHNLKNVPLSDEAIELILHDDLTDVTRQLTALAWVRGLDEPRRWVCYNMAFNLGVPGFMSFTNTIAHIKAGRYDDAATAMLQSRWAQQVGPRAVELAAQMRTGRWQ